MTTTVDIDCTYPDGQPRGYQTVLVTLVHGGAGGSDGTSIIGDTRRITLDADGHAAIELVPNDDITPSGTFYRFTVEKAQPSVVRHMEVPETGATVSWSDPTYQVETPVPPTFVNVVEATIDTAGPAIALQAAEEAVSEMLELGAGLQESPAGFASTVPVDVQAFSSSGTWTKPADVTWLQVTLIGPGGSGGSGRRGAEGSWRAGGSGGAGGPVVTAWIAAADVTGTVAVTIGQPGAVGAAVAVNNTNGNSAAAGTSTTFGAYLAALPGGLGAGGTGTAATDETIALSFRAAEGSTGPQGVGALSYNLLALGLLVPPGGGGFAGGGGCGSWRSETNTTPIAGSSGGYGAGGAGGAADTAGTAGTFGLGGGGGGGGHAGAGGAGGYPGGGGGGGRATANGTASGAGGLGGAGYVRVLAFR